MLKLVPTAFGMSYEDEKSRGPSFIESILSSNDETNIILGAFTDDKLIGSVGLVAEKRPKSRHKAIIWGMYVQEVMRGQGLGRLFVDSAIEHARKQRQLWMIHLLVESSNSVAKTLYDAYGFIVWGREPRALCIDGKFYDEDHMYLELT